MEVCGGKHRLVLELNDEIVLQKLKDIIFHSMKKFEDLSAEEQKYWDKFGRNLTKLQILWIHLSNVKKCLYCKKNYPDGIVKKHPSAFFGLSAEKWFAQDWLFHIQSTHGLDPMSVTDMLHKIK